MIVQYLAIFILALLIISSRQNFKKTAIIWIPMQLMFNAQVAIRYSSPAMSLALAGNLCLLAMYYIKSNKEVFNSEKFIFTVPFCFIISSYLISFVFGDYKTVKAATTMLKYFITGFGTIFLTFRCVNTKQDILLFVKASFVVFFLITLLGVFENVFKHNIWLDFVYYNSPMDESTAGRMYYDPNQIETRYGLVRARSTFGIHLMFGFACSVYFWMMYLLFREKLYIISKTRLLIISILLFGGIMMANSKTGYVGLFFLLMSIFPLSNLLNIKSLLPVAILIVVVSVFFPEYLMNYTSLFNADVAAEGQGSTVAGRQMQFAVALNMFSRNPLFGNGPGSIDILKEVGDNYLIMGAESCWMQILPERGLYGALCYIILYVGMYHELKKVIPKRIAFFYYVAILVMETATGQMDMAIWATVPLVVRRIYQLKNKYYVVSKVTDDNRTNI